MRYINFNLSSLIRPVRFLIACCICALVLFSSAWPAYSATSRPTEGEANLTDIERKSQEAISDKKPGDFDLKKQQKETHPGLNEIQGTADIEKMKRPENSQDATSVEQTIKDVLENATGKK